MNEARSTARRAPRWRRFLGAYFHEGAYGYIGFVCLGLALDLLSVPPGPLPILVLVADAPFLWLLYHRGGRRWKRWAFLYGVLHFAFAIRWLAQIHPVQVLGAAFVLAPIYLLLGLAIRLLVFRRVPLMLAVGTGVVLEEMLRTVWMGGMPWPARSLSFANDALLDPGLRTLLPASAYFGAYAFSFLAGLTSAVVFYLPALRTIEPGLRKRARLRLLRTALVPLAFLALLAGLAAHRRGRVEDGGLRETDAVLVAVQAAVPQELKHARDKLSIGELFDRHVHISATALDGLGEDERAFAVLWPETMIPWPAVSPALAPRYPEYWDDQVGVLRRIRADVPAGRDLEWLIGSIYQFRRGDEVHVDLWDYGSHDSLFHVRPVHAPTMSDPTPAPGAGPPPWEFGRHDKVKLVPGGEYTPLGEVLPPLRWFRNLVSVIPELDPGAAEQTPFALGGAFDEDEGLVRMGTVICFEIAFPAECRAWRRRGAQVLLNAANYGWFGRTGFRSQIQSVARLRAAELGVTVAMAGNTGPTAFYDPLGRAYGRFTAVADATEAPVGGRETTFRQGWARAPVRLDEGAQTVYTRWGDAPWWALALLLLLLALRPARNPAEAADASSREGIG